MRKFALTNLSKGFLLFACVTACQGPATLWAQQSVSTQTVPADVQAATQPGDSDDAASLVPPSTPSEEEPEVMTRGPVHEAYADPVNLEPEAKSLAVPKAPPAAIKELPPPDRPDGNQYVWVPGYWAWDGDRANYIWVSACWRVPPPQMYWVPGYWNPVGGTWQWVPGFWAPSASRQIEYLPAPPAPIVVEPTFVAPSPDYTWAPPCYYWVNGAYVLRPGYWVEARPGWVWVPSHTAWTPRGYVFASGHWDYPVERRGVLFCPVYFPPAVVIGPAYVYTPSVVVNVSFLTVGLFVYPTYGHYYFGDYYDSVYIGVGIYPWSIHGPHRNWCDPIYDHERWRNRHDSHWEDNARHHYEDRRDHRDLRPAHDYRSMERQVASLPAAQRRDREAARPLSRVVAERSTGGDARTDFRRMSPSAQERVAERGANVQRFGEERTKWEAPTTSGSGTIERGGNRGANQQNTTPSRGGSTGGTRPNATTGADNGRGNQPGNPTQSGGRTRPSTPEQANPSVPTQSGGRTRPSTPEQANPSVPMRGNNSGSSSQPTRESTGTTRPSTTGSNANQTGNIPTRGGSSGSSSMPTQSGQTSRPSQSGSSTSPYGGQADRQRVPSPPVIGRSGGSSSSGGTRQPSYPSSERQLPSSGSSSSSRGSSGGSSQPSSPSRGESGGSSRGSDSGSGRNR